MLEAINYLKRLDWVLIGAVALVYFMGLATFYGDSASKVFFYRQLVFGILGLFLIIGLSFFNWRIFKESAPATAAVYIFGVLLLFVLFVIGSQVRGVVSWFKVGWVNIEPAEAMKIILALVLAKFFSSRYIELHRWKNIIISGVYALLPIGLILIQPDFGSALILAAVWFVLVLVSGIKAKQVLYIFIMVLITLAVLWGYGLKDYQQVRILSFLNPSEDPLGGAYQSQQSIIAIGSGGWLGKQLGQGTQTRLGFLPEYHTDFIFSAIAEEWGLIGVIILLGSWLVIFKRFYRSLALAPDNFSRLFIMGIITILGAHFIVNLGANLGFLPITGISLPFVSYGGSNLLSLCAGLGLVQSIKCRVLSWRFEPEKTLWQE